MSPRLQRLRLRCSPQRTPSSTESSSWPLTETATIRDIISEYGNKAGKAVYLYAGLSALNLQQYDEAIKYLKKYKAKDNIMTARALMAIGDSYEGLGDTANALAYWDKSTKVDEEMLFNASTLIKMGITYEEQGQPEKALACYKKIEDKYPQSIEGYDIAKYITRIETAR